MNLALRARDVLEGLSPMLVKELDSLVERINLVWTKGHNPANGQHTNLVFDSSTATQTTVGAAGSAEALPATPTGYLVTTIAGTEVLIPYYDKA